MRVEQLAEALQIIRAMWVEEEATFQGRYYRVAHARCEPRPNPVPPMLVGASGLKMLRLTARYADWWDVSSKGVGEYRVLAAGFERACADVGRDPATVRRSWSGGCACAATRAEVRALAGDRFGVDDEDFSFVGTPEEIVDQMRSFVALGVEYFILDGAGFPDLTTLRLLVEEVLPRLKQG